MRALQKRQQGQAMAEYLVVLMVLVAALLAPGLGSVGVDQSERDSLLWAVTNKHRGHMYALSLSEIPETDDLVKLSAYYDVLGKYPELSPQLQAGGQKLGELAQRLGLVNAMLSNFDPGSIPTPSPPSLSTPDLGAFTGLP